MYELQIRKGGKAYHKYWDAELQDFIEDEVKAEDLYLHLYDIVCLEKGTSLRDIFLLISKNIKLFKNITGQSYLKDTIKKALAPFDISEKLVGLGAIQLEWIGQYDADNTFEIFTLFEGIGQNEEYNLENFPINSYSKFPLILNEEFTIRDFHNKEILKGRKLFTLIDIVRGILSEVNCATSIFKDLSDDIKLVLSKEEIDLPTINCLECGNSILETICFERPRLICFECFDKEKRN